MALCRDYLVSMTDQSSTLQEQSMRRCLLVSPYFPPVGVSGTKRALHLSRHLSSFGWDPIILTGSGLGEPIDESLMECVPSERIIDRSYAGKIRSLLHSLKAQKKKNTQFKARAQQRRSSFFTRFKPKNLQYWLPFDRYWLDQDAGYQAMKRLIQAYDIELIHVSADPWAPLKVAQRVSQELTIPLIVDFRDPWSIHEGKMALRPAYTRWLIRRFEKKLFKQASAIILNTETACSVYQKHYQADIPQERFHTVRNAFDRGLFRRVTDPKNHEVKPACFKALYFGRFRAFVSPEVLFRAFVQYTQKLNLTPSQAQLEIVGGLSDEHLQLAEHCGISAFLTLSSSVPFRDCLPTLQSASALILVIEPECYMQIPGKLYDYFAAARPIIALSANQEANQMITEVHMGVAIDHQDLDAITQALVDQYQTWKKSPKDDFVTLEALVEPYSAHRQAEKIATLYEQVCTVSNGQS